MKPNFSVCFIGRNESSVLQRALNSLKTFKEMGGEICYLDTGSTDNTIQIAKDFGCKTEAVGSKFLTSITKEQAEEVNKKFLVDNESAILEEGGKLFDFASARNYCAENLATNDMIACLDCDEAYTSFDISVICKYISDGVDQFEYEFVFAHDHLNNPLLQFIQSKFYNKKKIKWVGIVHEVLSGEGRRERLPEKILKNEHWQNRQTNRSGYLRGLALDCFLNPKKDRQSHYFARELMWNNRPKSAIKEFERYLTISWWKPERSQSMIFIGDCHKTIGNKDRAVEWYHRAFQEESNRREPLIRLAEIYLKKDMQKVICYCKAALEIEWNGGFANNKYHYGHIPHELLAEAYWTLGRREEARIHIEMALKHMPTSGKLLYDYRFHYTLPKISFIIPKQEEQEKLFHSIKLLNYPQDMIEIIFINDEPISSVSKKIESELEKSTGEYVIYASNDCKLTPDSLMIAYRKIKNCSKALSSSNAEPVNSNASNICDCFMVKKSLIKEKLNNETSDTEMVPVWWDRIKKIHQEAMSSDTMSPINQFCFLNKPAGEINKNIRVYIDPPKYFYAISFENIFNLMVNSLKDLGYYSENYQESNYAIFICDIPEKYLSDRKNKQIILIQTEQKYSPIYDITKYYKFLPDIKIWGFDNDTKEEEYLIMGYHPSLEREYNNSKCIDVGLCGNFTDRRKSFLQNAKHQPVNISAWGDKRLENIQKTKININIHSYQECNYTEWDRLSILLANKCFILSEVLYCPITIPQFSSAIDYDEKIDFWLNNPEKRQEICEKNYCNYRNNFDMRKILQEKLK